MRKAYDNILSDYIEAEDAAKNCGFEPYRYICPHCQEDVYLCAAESSLQATHFRHRDGNNNSECEYYLGNSYEIGNNQNPQIKRDKIEIYFSNSKKLFSIGVKFNADEIASSAKNGDYFQVKNETDIDCINKTPINSGRFFPDVFELFSLNHFAWEYMVSSTTVSKERKYSVFKKDEKGNAVPIFFKIQAGSDDVNFTAKLVRTEYLYTNTDYFIVYPGRSFELGVEQNLQIKNPVLFKTMNRDFVSSVVTFNNNDKTIKKQLEIWQYKLEDNETLMLLWPPSSMIEDKTLIKTRDVFIFSSFELKAHSNINKGSENIVKSVDGFSIIKVEDKANICKKNSELFLVKSDRIDRDYDVINVSKETLYCFKAIDDEAYIFNSSGVSLLHEGEEALLTRKSEIRHYMHGYLDQVVKAPLDALQKDEKKLIQKIILYYRREEPFDWCDYESLNLSQSAMDYLKYCERESKINSAVKRYIKEGRI